MFNKLKFFSVLLLLFSPLSQSLQAKKIIKAKICNDSRSLIRFDFFAARDLVRWVPFAKKTLKACHCITENLDTNMFGENPRAKVFQLLKRDVSATVENSVDGCLEAGVEAGEGVKGKVDAKVCASHKKGTEYGEAKEITQAQGDQKVLNDNYIPNNPSKSGDPVIYTYSDGTGCIK